MTTLPLYEKIKQIFLGSEFSSLEGEFLTGKIFEAIEKLDKSFIAILLQNQTTKEHFFEVIEDAYILNQNKLYEFFNAKEYFDNSFTSYTNKIGLIKKDSFIKKFDDVVLAFPYKDCILEGGMSNEDVAKKEVFYNAIISKEEIDRLFEPKVLTNIKKFDKVGQSSPSEISMDDNLILKGNNLLALHSLKQRYTGQIKLIYIDPPYNTGNDGFKYNDRFNHSTWLTFMKNRLEVARELLKDDGVIFVSIDDNEQAYLKVLMDEIFGRENFIANFVWKKRSGTNDSVNFSSIDHEYVLAYSSSSKFKFIGVKKHFSNYKNPDNDIRGAWTSGDLTCNKTAVERPNLYYDITDPKTNLVYKCNPNRVWRTIESKMLELIKKDKIIFPKDGIGTPQYKRHLEEVKSDFKPVS
ncbi:site-specific DNA-methyltransferase, partial [Sulfurospirillum sp. T05]